MIAQGFFLLSINLFPQINIDKVLCENRKNPLGIDIDKPKFTWVLSSRERSKKQSAYQIQVSSKNDDFDEQLIWDSGKTNSNRSVTVPYGGPELHSLKRYYWRTKVWDEKGKPSKMEFSRYVADGNIEPNRLES